MTFDVELIDSWGWKVALRGLRRPMNKAPSPQATSGIPSTQDFQLLSRLSSAGDDHSKVLRLLWVGLTIRAPRYWWMEFDTYCLGRCDLDEEHISESTMHRKLSEPFVKEDFEDGMITTNQLARLVFYADKVRRQELSIDLLKRELLESFLQTRDVELNYQALRRIYFARKSHRLPHWRKFCEWIEAEVPYFREINL